MKKFFSLVLALVMALSLTTVAWGAALPSAVNDVIALDADFTLNVQYTLSSGNVTIKAADPTKPVTITTSVVDAIVVTGGTLTLGEGVTIESTKGAILYANGGTIIIDGATLEATNPQYDLAAVQNNGTLTVQGGSVSSTGANNTTIAVTNGGTINVSGGKVYSGTGSALAIGDASGGTINVSGGTISTDASSPFAAVFGYSGTINVTGGTMTAANSIAVVASNAATANVSGGNVQSVGVVNAGGQVKVTGGTFEVAPKAEYLADGYVYVNGEVKKTTSAGNTAVLDVDDLTVTDKLGANVPTTGITSIVKVAATTNKTTVDGKTTTKVVPTWYQIEFTTGSEIYVECDKSVADLMFTFKGAGSVYVRYMAAVPTAFDATPVTLYTAPKTATCDKVGANEDVYVVVDGKYYATDPNVVAGTEKYALLSNGKMVVYYGEATAKPHNWAQATKNTYDAKTGAITSVKCPDCKNSIAVYAVPGSFDGKTYVQITDANSVAYGYYFVAGAAANTVTGTVTGTTTTGTVQSAETFDAGIAMYVGMSVLAATGSAVVLKKREG